MECIHGLDISQPCPLCEEESKAIRDAFMRVSVPESVRLLQAQVSMLAGALEGVVEVLKDEPEHMAMCLLCRGALKMIGDEEDEEVEDE